MLKNAISSSYGDWYTCILKTTTTVQNTYSIIVTIPTTLALTVTSHYYYYITTNTAAAVAALNICDSFSCSLCWNINFWCRPTIMKTSGLTSISQYKFTISSVRLVRKCFYTILKSKLSTHTAVIILVSWAHKELQLTVEKLWWALTYLWLQPYHDVHVYKISLQIQAMCSYNV